MTGFDVSNLSASLGIVLLGLAVHLSVRLLYGPYQPTPGDQISTMLVASARTMIISGFVAGCLLLMGVVLGIIFLLTVGVVVCIALIRRTAGRQRALLALLASAARRSVPLAPAVHAFAADWRGVFQLRLARLAELLSGGTPLDQALKRVPGAVPSKALPLVHVGARTGSLADALIESSYLATPSNPVLRALAAAWYFAWVSLSLAGVLTFMMIKLVPIYLAIMQDMQAAVPAITQSLVNVSNWLAQYSSLAAIAILLAAIAILLAAASAGLLYALGVHHDTPWMVDPQRQLHAALVLRGLALSVADNRPMIDGLRVLAQVHPRAAVRRRLNRTLDEVEAGADWSHSLHNNGILRAPEVAIIQSASRVGNLAWALREAAAGLERRFGYRLQTAIDVCVPLVVFALGAAVAFVAVAMFLPLVNIIEAWL